MPRHNALIPLSHDHHHALVVALRLKKEGPTTEKDTEWPKDFEGHVAAILHFAEADLLPHFALEESILFLFLKDYSSNFHSLIGALEDQHQMIREHIRQIELERSNLENPALKAELRSLGLLLDQHIRKEERELFPLIEREIPPEALESLSKRVAEAHAAYEH